MKPLPLHHQLALSKVKGPSTIRYLRCAIRSLLSSLRPALYALRSTPYALLFFLFLILYPLLLTPAYADITNPVAPTFSTGEPGEVLAKMVASIWKAAVVMGGILFVLYFVWGALRWMTAEGDKTKFESGREKITDAMIGLVLLVASVAIIQLLGTLLDIPFLKVLMFTLPEPTPPEP